MKTLRSQNEKLLLKMKHFQNVDLMLEKTLITLRLLMDLILKLKLIQNLQDYNFLLHSVRHHRPSPRSFRLELVLSSPLSKYIIKDSNVSFLFIHSMTFGW